MRVRAAAAAVVVVAAGWLTFGRDHPSTATTLPPVATTTSTTTIPAKWYHPWYYPILLLGPRVWHRFECVIWVQSRSTFAKPNIGDNTRHGSSGIYQIEPVLWDRWAPLAHVRVPVWLATPLQQSLVAAVIYEHDGFSPWGGC